MAGDYEIIHAFHIGDKEIVIGENIEADDDERYPPITFWNRLRDLSGHP